jgi:hypothetical protein
MNRSYHSSRLSRTICAALYRHRRVAKVSFLATALIAGLAATPVAALVGTATLNTAGNWNDPTIWSSNPLFPNNGTPAGETWNVNVGLSVTVNTPITVDNLNWSAGSITDSSSLDLVGSASLWSSGSFKDINGPLANFRNSGTINLTGTNVRSLAAGSGLTNLSGGVFNISSDGAALVTYQVAL